MAKRTAAGAIITSVWSEDEIGRPFRSALREAQDNALVVCDGGDFVSAPCRFRWHAAYLVIVGRRSAAPKPFLELGAASAALFLTPGSSIREAAWWARVGVEPLAVANAPGARDTPALVSNPNLSSVDEALTEDLPIRAPP